ncbi:MFS transporter [Streptomyces cyaneofuscatus]|uniref:MFS transporter n=1 Tax=Streptomyces cyaneofuscatus TaxID=66883 RepID=UPI002FF429E7
MPVADDSLSATSTVAPPPSPGRSQEAFVLLAAVQVVLVLAITMLSVALPTVRTELGLSVAQLTLISAAYGLSFGGLLLLGGRIADLYGRRRVFVAGTALFGLASAVGGFAPDVTTLLTARLVQGAGAAFAAPAAMALAVSLHQAPRARARAMGIWGALAPLGAAVGTLVSGAAIVWFSWRWTFLVPTLVAVVAVLLAPQVLPRDAGAPAGGKVDVLGAVLATAGLSLLSYGLVHAAETAWTSAAVTVPSVLGVVLLAAFALVERRAPDPLLPPGFLVSRRRATALWAVLIASAGTATMFFLLSLYFQQVADLSPLRTSAAFLPFTVVLLAVGPLGGRLVARFGSRTVIAAGLLLAAAGLLLLGRLTDHSPYAGPVLAGLLLLPAGIALVFSAATITMLNDVPAEQSGLAGGVVNTALETGPTIGLAVLASLAASHTAGLTGGATARTAAEASGYAFAFTTAGVVFAVSALAAVLLLRGQSRHDAPADRA